MCILTSIHAGFVCVTVEFVQVFCPVQAKEKAAIWPPLRRFFNRVSHVRKIFFFDKFRTIIRKGVFGRLKPIQPIGRKHSHDLVDRRVKLNSGHFKALQIGTPDHNGDLDWIVDWLHAYLRLWTDQHDSTSTHTRV